MKMHKAAWVAMLCLGLVTPLAASADTDSVAGTWKGSWSSDMRDSYAKLVLNLRQKGNDIVGRFTCSGGTLPCYAPAAELTGRLDGPDFIGRVHFPDGHLCGMSGSVEDRRLHGEYSCNDEKGKDRGQWEARLDRPGPINDPDPERSPFR